MNKSRRKFLAALAATGVGAAAWRYWPDGGFFNPCRTGKLPKHLRKHDVVLAAWQGIDPNQLWDGHVHLVGVGDSDSGIWLTPRMDDVTHLSEYIQKQFYLNASCTERAGSVDVDFVKRIVALQGQFKPGAKSLLLAFDYAYAEPVSGNKKNMPVLDRSSFYVPNEYAMRVAQTYPDKFEWIASIHPYRDDCVEALKQAVANGARAVKWLPAAQGMDPGNPLCAPFYEAMASLNIPLLVHAGREEAVKGGDTQDYGNPLRLRVPLDAGVRVIVAHCASLGEGIDLDVGVDGPMISNFELFERLMAENDYNGRVYGEISTVTQINRLGPPLEAAILRDEWRGRLLNASDYPLPGIVPLFSLPELQARGYINETERNVLSEIRQYNPMLFDFVLKRTVQIDGKRIARDTFHTRWVFDNNGLNG